MLVRMWVNWDLLAALCSAPLQLWCLLSTLYPVRAAVALALGYLIVCVCVYISFPFPSVLHHADSSH